jgi:hypothetical protein
MSHRNGICYNVLTVPSIAIIRQAAKRNDLRPYLLGSELVKAVVDIENGIMAIGGELHADEEQVLLEQGSKQEHLWGINLYPDETTDDWIEFDSMINVRPLQGNRSRSVENPALQQTIRSIVAKLVP